MPIQRVHPGPRMSEMVIHNETVYLSGQIGLPISIVSVGPERLQSISVGDSGER